MICSRLAHSSYRSFALVLGTLWVLLVLAGSVCAQPYPFTLDFEDGTLRGWTTTGNAFARQPVRGETRIAVERGQPSRRQGSYWISTYLEQPRTEFLSAVVPRGDGPQGTLTSASFTIPEGRLTFLVGGGSSSQTRVELLVGPGSDIEFMEPVHAVSGRNSETMERVSWELSPYAGKIGRIRLVDASSESWGHINADDFRFVLPAPLRTSVPGVVGDTEAVAIQKLAEARLRPGQVTSRASGRREGTILEQSPQAGTEVPVDTPVHLVVASPDVVVVPRVIGHLLAEAEELLIQARMDIGRVEERPSDARPGTVIEQNPAPGARAAAGSRVDLAVAVVPGVRMIEVPDVTGLPLDKARRVLAARQLVAGEISERESDREAGIILEQSPAAGSAAFFGDSVGLVVAARSRAFPWVWVGVGLAATGAVGMLLRLVRRSRRNVSSVGGLEVVPRVDEGCQEIIFWQDEDTANWEITLHAVPDPGEQALEVMGELIAEKEGEHG